MNIYPKPLMNMHRSGSRRRTLRTAIASVTLGATLAAIGVGSDTSFAGVDPDDPIVAPSDPVISAVSAGDYHTCAIVDGAVYCWGSNGDGRLGIGNEYSEDYIDDLIDSREEELAADPAFVGDAGDEAERLIAEEYELEGYNTDTPNSFLPFRVLGNSHSATSFVNSGITAVATGEYHTCAIKSGSLYCWGSNSSGQLGLGQTFSSDYVEEVLNGDEDITPEQIAEYAAKGYDIGEDSAFLPIKVPNVASGFTNSNVTAIAAAGDTTCAISGGSLYCWGNNESGQLGDGTIGEDAGSFEPQEVPPTANTGDLDAMPDFVNTNVTSIDISSAYHVCTVASGSAFCWGEPGSGHLGDGRTRGGSSTTPHFVGYNIDLFDEFNAPAFAQQFGNTNITAVSVDKYHSCLLKEEGPVGGPASLVAYCWGTVGFDALGLANPTAAPSYTSEYVTMPTKVDDNVAQDFTNSGIDEISAGDYHTCAIKDGVSFCWGVNQSGEVGDGTKNSVGLATKVSAGVVPASVNAMANPVFTNINTSSISAGYSYTCVIAGGYLYCWGYNYYGQLGEGSLDADEYDNPFVSPEYQLPPTLVFRYPDPASDDGGGDDGGDDGGGDDGGDGGGWNGSYQIPSGVLLPDTR